MRQTPRRLLVTVAHPDDESFGTGSVIAATVRAGTHVTVCCATRGEAGEVHRMPPGADIAAVREAELRSAGAALGVSRIVLLGYRDSGMTGQPGPATLAGAPLAEIVAAVQGVVEEIDPDVVVTLDPDHGDGHRDHAVIGRATVAACRDRPNVRVYAWALLRSLLVRWLGEPSVRPQSAHLDLDQPALGRPDDQITTILDVAHVRPTREWAIAQHRSQVSPFEGMPDDLRTEFLSTDRLVRLQPRWSGRIRERALF